MQLARSSTTRLQGFARSEGGSITSFKIQSVLHLRRTGSLLRGLSTTESKVGKRSTGPLFCAGRVPVNVDAQLPVVVVRVGGKMVRGLVDTGCSVTMMEQRLVRPDQIQSVSEKLQRVLVQAVMTHLAWGRLKCRGSF